MKMTILNFDKNNKEGDITAKILPLKTFINWITWTLYVNKTKSVGAALYNEGLKIGTRI
jgi:hypothetical protein